MDATRGLDLERRGPRKRVLDAFDSGARLVYIHGPGGVGKSWLARAVSADLCARDVEVAWVDTEFVTDEEELAERLGRALDVPGEGLSRSAVGRALRGRSDATVILDGAEGLVASGALRALLDEWRAVSPSTKWLVSTRVALGTADAHRIPLEPFEAAPSGEARAGDAMSEAARFVTNLLERRGRQPHLDDRASLEAICAYVDGLPLALELLAARLEVLPAEEILKRLRTRTLALKNTAPGKPRQTSLEASLGWSWEQLTGDERRAMTALSRFSRPQRAELVESVLAAVLGPADALDAISGLLNCSMLARLESPSGARLLVFASIQRFALAQEQPDAGAEVDFSVVEGLARYYLSLHRDAMGPQQAEVRTTLEESAPFFLGLVGRRELPASLRSLAVSALFGLRFVIGRAASLASMVDAVNTLDAEATHEERLMLNLVAARHALEAEQLESTEHFLERAAEVLPRTEMPELHAEAALVEGMLRYRQGRTEQSERQFERAQAMLKDRGQQDGPKGSIPPWSSEESRLWLVGAVSYEQGRALSTRRRAGGAAALFARAEEAFRVLGDPSALAGPLSGLGFLAQDEGKSTESQRYLGAGLEAAELARDALLTARMHGYLGNLARLKADREEAEAEYAACDAQLARLGDLNWRSVFAMDSGILLVDRQDLDAAEAEFARAVDLAREAESRLILQLSAAYLEALRARRGLPPPAGSGHEELGRSEEVAFTTLSNSLHVATGFWRGHLQAQDVAAAANGLEDLAAVSQHARYVRRFLRRVVEAQAPSPGTLWFSFEEKAFTLSGAPAHAIPKRAGCEAMFGFLIRQRLDAKGRWADIPLLFAMGWPDEQAGEDAMKNRVRVAVAALRKAGLGDAIENQPGGGYRIAPDVPVVLSAWRGVKTQSPRDR